MIPCWRSAGERLILCAPCTDTGRTLRISTPHTVYYSTHVAHACYNAHMPRNITLFCWLHCKMSRNRHAHNGRHLLNCSTPRNRIQKTIRKERRKKTTFWVHTATKLHVRSFCIDIKVLADFAVQYVTDDAIAKLNVT